MKHGPIALLDRRTLVVAAPHNPWYEKMFSHVEQAKSRGGMVISVATDGDKTMAGNSDHMMWVPGIPRVLSLVTTVIPLQMLAYHITALSSLDVDQARNLVKNVWSKLE